MSASSASPDCTPRAARGTERPLPAPSCRLVGYIALAFYDYVGPTAAFYVAAIAAAVYAVVFGIFYALRIGRTSAGFTAGLSAVETELLVSRTTRT